MNPSRVRNLEAVLQDGVKIAYEDRGQGDLVVVLLHGLGCDRSYLSSQAKFLASMGFRVLSPDLRGYGHSSAPRGDYTMSVLANDIAGLCSQLNVEKAFFVGHSMGGNVALTLAAAGDLSQGLVLIDSLVFAAEETLQALTPLRELIRGSDYPQAFHIIFRSLFADVDDPRICEEILRRGPSAPQHVTAACLDAHFAQDDFAASAESIHGPIAYIGATKPLGDVHRLALAVPQLLQAQTLAAGHFCPLTTPVQINAMILDFISSVIRSSGAVGNLVL